MIGTNSAEYVAISKAARDIRWLRQLLYDFALSPGGGLIDSQVFLFNDNKGAISLARNPVNHNQHKHIDIRYHFIREVVSKQELQLKYVPTEDNIADALTKVLPRSTFDRHVPYINGYSDMEDLVHYYSFEESRVIIHQAQTNEGSKDASSKAQGEVMAADLGKLTPASVSLCCSTV